MRRLIFAGLTVLTLLLGSAVPALAAGHNPVCTIAADRVAGTPGAAGVSLGCSNAP